MSGNPPRNESNSAAVLESVSRRFRELLEADGGASIEEYVSHDEVSLTDDLLSELVQLEVAHRSGSRSGSLTDLINDYVVRFPNQRNVIHHAFQSLLADHGNGRNGRNEPSNHENMPGADQDLDKTVSTCGQTGPSDEFRKMADDFPEHVKRVGRYTVVQKLGSGGQGIVYRAIHPTLPIEVAIKVSAQPLDERFHKSLKEEVLVLNELDHPGIARVRDFDIEDGRPFLVMDFIRGRSLNAILVTGEVPISTVMMWLADVADAIDYAHRRGILHLDLKPQNIVIDEHGQPKVIDFGLARVRGAWDADAVESDSISGTLGYMSPEQASGVAQRIDARSDVFALGSVLYRIITGKPPFHGEDAGKVLQAARSCEFDRQALIDSAVPKTWMDICLKAMERDPNQRFENAKLFAAAIRSAVDPPAVNHQQPWRKPTTWVLTVAALLVGIVFMTRSLSDGNSSSAPKASKPMTIDGFRVTHRGRSAGEAVFLSELFEERASQVDDDLRIDVDFSEPAYSFLFALNPDGQIQLCYPELDETPPEPKEHLGFPQERDLAFGLTDGAGYQVFCLVASSKPLPAFNQWRKRLPKDPNTWTNGLSGNWVYLQGSVTPRSFRKGQEIRTRGELRKVENPKRSWSSLIHCVLRTESTRPQSYSK